MREKVLLMWSRLFVRMVMVILLAPTAEAFAAQEASKESLNRLFQVTNEASLVDQVLESASGALADEWRKETDPDKQARKKEKFEIADQIIKKHFNWSAIEPLALESYQKRFQEEEINGLIDYFRSPVGQLRVTKMAPALVKSIPQIRTYMHERVTEIVSRNFDEHKHPVKKAVAWKPPVAGSKEELAWRLMRDLPGARDRYQTEMAGIEISFMKKMEPFTSGKSGSLIKPKLKRIAKELKSVSFDEIAAVYAKALAENLSETEMATLIEDGKNTSTKAWLAKVDGADRELEARLNVYLQEKVLPELIEVMLETKKEEKSEPEEKPES